MHAYKTVAPTRRPCWRLVWSGRLSLHSASAGKSDYKEKVGDSFHVRELTKVRDFSQSHYPAWCDKLRLGLSYRRVLGVALLAAHSFSIPDAGASLTAGRRSRSTGGAIGLYSLDRTNTGFVSFLDRLGLSHIFAALATTARPFPEINMCFRINAYKTVAPTRRCRLVCSGRLSLRSASADKSDYKQKSGDSFHGGERKQTAGFQSTTFSSKQTCFRAENRKR